MVPSKEGGKEGTNEYPFGILGGLWKFCDTLQTRKELSHFLNSLDDQGTVPAFYTQSWFYVPSFRMYGIRWNISTTSCSALCKKRTMRKPALPPPTTNSVHKQNSRPKSDAGGSRRTQTLLTTGTSTGRFPTGLARSGA